MGTLSVVDGTKRLLSTSWIFVTVNYIFCDVVTLMNPKDLKNILSGTVGTIQMNETFLLGASVMMEIPFAMILLSRVLAPKVNRWANLIAASIMTIVQAASLFAGSGTSLHYMFFSAVEIGCTLFVMAFAWRWQRWGSGTDA